MAGFLSITMVDGFGRTTSKRIEFQDHALLVDYVLEANNFMSDLAVVSDLQIVRADMVINDGLTLPETNPAGSNVDVGATFVGYVYGGEGDKAVFKIPGIDLSYVDSLGNIDVADEDIESLLARFVHGDDSVGFYLSDGEEIATWIGGTLDK